MKITHRVRADRKPLVLSFNVADDSNEKVDLEIILFEPKRKAKTSIGKNKVRSTLDSNESGSQDRKDIGEPSSDSAKSLDNPDRDTLSTISEKPSPPENSDEADAEDNARNGGKLPQDEAQASKSPLIDRHLLDQMESRFRGGKGLLSNAEDVYIDYMDYF